MNRAEIIRMARESGIPAEHANIGDGIMVGMVPPMALERFANLVAAAKQEECAKVCEDQALGEANDCWDSAYKHVASECAAAIRALK